MQVRDNNHATRIVSPGWMATARERGRVPALAFLLGFVYLLFSMFLPLNPYDEGFVLVGAEGIRHGAVPYRDFAAYYTPGQYYTLAGVFRIFGSSILVERTWDMVVRFSVCVLAFLVARTLTRSRAAYLPFFITLLFFGWCWFYSYPVVPAMFWALTAVLLLIRGWPENRPRPLALAGLAVGLSAFYRQDVGAYAFASGTIALVVEGAMRPPDANCQQVGVIKRLEPLVWYALGTCVVAVPLLAYILRKVPLGELWDDFVKFPRLQIELRHLPLPPVIPSGAYLLSSMGLAWPWSPGGIWFFFYTPVAVYAVTAVKLLAGIARPAAGLQTARQQFARVVLTSFGLLLLVTGVARADLIHCLAPTIPAAILVVLIFQEWPPRRRWSTPLLAACLVALAVPYVASPMLRWGLALRIWPRGPTSSLARARFFSVPTDQEAAVRFIRQHVPEGKAIFVGNTQHRRIYANDVVFYFLAERRPGTRYEEFMPGIVTTAAVQGEIVRELQASHVDWVVLFSGFESAAQRFSSGQEGAVILDDFLRAEYRKVDTFGRYTVLARNNGARGDTAN